MPDTSFYKKILSLALPLILANLLQQVYNITDAFFMGQFSGSIALAAVGVSGQVALIMIFLFIGMSVGASIVAAQSYGARNFERLHSVVHTTVGLSLASGLFLTVAGLLGGEEFLSWMNVPDEVMPSAKLYLQVFFLSMIPLLVYNMGSGLLRALNDTRTAMYALVISCFVKISLNTLFVAVLGWGLAGAASTTCIAQSFAMLLVLYRLKKLPVEFRLSWRSVHLDREMLKAIFGIGIPAGIQAVVQCFSNLYFQAKINVFGADAMAGAVAFGRIDGFLYMPIEGFALAASTLAGQSIGAREFDKIKPLYRSVSFMSVGLTIVLSAVILLGAPWIMKLFNPDNQVALDYSINMVGYIIPLYFLYGLNQNFAGVIRGTGEARVPMAIVLVFTCAFRVAWNTTFSHDIVMLYYSYPVSWMITWAAYATYYAKGDWLRRHMTAREQS